MTAVLPMSMGNMDNRSAMYQSGMHYMSGNYISPSPSIYPTSYETSPTPVQAGYAPGSMIPQRPMQDWNDQDITLFSHSERAIAKERRREQNRASQRAYRKRKEDTVKGLYESVKDLRKNSEALRTENTLLKDELKRLREENRKLRAQSGPSKSCLQCSEAGVSCSKAHVNCTRCEESGLSCSISSIDSTSQDAIVEMQGHGNSSSGHLRPAADSKTFWYDTRSQIPVISESIPAESMTAYNLSTYAQQDAPGRDHSPYEVDDDDESLTESMQDDYQTMLDPQSRQMYRAQSLQALGPSTEQTRPRSTSLYRIPDP